MDKIFASLQKKLLSTRDLVEKITLITHAITETLHVDRCTLFVYDPDTDSFWSAYIDGLGFIEIPRGQGLVSETFESKKPTLFNDVKKEKGHYQKIDEKTGYVTRTMLTVPILNYQKESLGVIQLLNKLDGNHFTEDDILKLDEVIEYFIDFVENSIVRKN
jgi:signal transduction protein with GAF and PtsI domain